MHGSDIAIIIGSVLAALVAIVPMYFLLRQNQVRDRREHFEERIDDLSKELSHQRDRNVDLEAENLRLMRELFRRDPGK